MKKFILALSIALILIISMSVFSGDWGYKQIKYGSATTSTQDTIEINTSNTFQVGIFGSKLPDNAVRVLSSMTITAADTAYVIVLMDFSNTETFTTGKFTTVNIDTLEAESTAATTAFLSDEITMLPFRYARLRMDCKTDSSPSTTATASVSNVIENQYSIEF